MSFRRMSHKLVYSFLQNRKSTRYWKVHSATEHFNWHFYLKKSCEELVIVTNTVLYKTALNHCHEIPLFRELILSTMCIYITEKGKRSVMQVYYPKYTDARTVLMLWPK